MELAQLLWIVALPIAIFFTLRWGGATSGLFDKTFKTCLYGGLAGFGWAALAIGNVCFFSRQLQWRHTIGEFWFVLAPLPLFIYIASRMGARVTFRQATLASAATVVWLAIQWGIMIDAYFLEYGRSPFGYMERSEAVD